MSIPDKWSPSSIPVPANPKTEGIGATPPPVSKETAKTARVAVPILESQPQISREELTRQHSIVVENLKAAKNLEAAKTALLFLLQNEPVEKVADLIHSFMEAWFMAPETNVADLTFLDKIPDAHTREEIIKHTLRAIWPLSEQCRKNLIKIRGTLGDTAPLCKAFIDAHKSVEFGKFLEGIHALNEASPITEELLDKIIHEVEFEPHSPEELKSICNAFEATHIKLLHCFVEQYNITKNVLQAVSAMKLLNKIENTPRDQITVDTLPKWNEENLLQTHVDAILKKIKQTCWERMGDIYNTIRQQYANITSLDAFKQAVRAMDLLFYIETIPREKITVFTLLPWLEENLLQTHVDAILKKIKQTNWEGIGDIYNTITKSTPLEAFKKAFEDFLPSYVKILLQAITAPQLGREKRISDDQWSLIIGALNQICKSPRAISDLDAIVDTLEKSGIIYFQYLGKIYHKSPPQEKFEHALAEMQTLFAEVLEMPFSQFEQFLTSHDNWTDAEKKMLLDDILENSESHILKHIKPSLKKDRDGSWQLASLVGECESFNNTMQQKVGKLATLNELQTFLTSNTLVKEELEWLCSFLQNSENSDFQLVAKQYREEKPFGKEDIGDLQRIVWLAGASQRRISVDDVYQFLLSYPSPKQVETFVDMLQKSSDPILKQITDEYATQITKPILAQTALQNGFIVVSGARLDVVLVPDFSFTDLIRCLSFPRNEERTQEIWQKMQASKSPLIQETVAAIAESSPTQDTLVAALNAVKKKKLVRESTSIVEKKKTSITLTDIERLIRLEKRYNEELPDDEITKLSAGIAENDPLISSLRDKTTRKEFIAALNQAREKHRHDINEKLKSAKLLDEKEVERLLTMGPTDEQVTKIVEQSSMPSLKARFEQIQKATATQFETRAMPFRRVLEIALYIEQQKENLAKPNEIFKRCQTGLARTLQTSGEHVFIFARKKLSVLTGAGAFKRVTSAIGIPLKNYVETLSAARVFTNAQEISGKVMDETMQEVQEAIFHRGEPGFADCHGCVRYNFNLEGQDAIERISIVYTGYEGDVGDKNNMIISDTDKAKASSDILTAMASLHRKNKFHGDFKLKNCLFRKAGSTVEIAITDFGCTRKLTPLEIPGTFETPDCASYATGGYGAGFGPPWFNGRKNYQGDPRLVESFVVGQELWRLFYKEYAPEQINMQAALYKNITAITDDMRKDWKEKIEKAIQDKMIDSKLATRENGQFREKKWDELKDGIERMKFLMFKMLNPNEGKAMTILEADSLLHPKPPQK